MLTDLLQEVCAAEQLGGVGLVERGHDGLEHLPRRVRLLLGHPLRIGRGGRGIFFGIFSGDLDLGGCLGGLCGLGLGLLDGLPLLVMRWRLAVVAPLRRVLVVRLDDLEVTLGRLGRFALLKCHGNQHKSQSGGKISSRSID